MKKALWIGLAGAVGAIARVTAGTLFFSASSFPTTTLLINLLGTFLLCLLTAGMVSKLKMKKEIQEIVSIGFLGSFTTFSAFTMETVSLVENGEIACAGVYIVCSMIGGLLAARIGFSVGGKRWSHERT